jgi:hypothetical protein
MFKTSFSQIRPAPFADLWETFNLRGSMAGAGINLEQADAFALKMRWRSQQRELQGIFSRRKQSEN